MGTNVGSLRDNLRRGLERLKTDGLTVLRISSLYRTSPVDYREQDWFLNMVVEIETLMTPEKLLHHCQAVEEQLGRKRLIEKGPRTPDVDILFYGSEVIRNAGLIIPHPQIAERKFVLVPLAEIAPHLIHPVTKKSVLQMLQERASDPAQVEHAGAL